MMQLLPFALNALLGAKYGWKVVHQWNISHGLAKQRHCLSKRKKRQEEKSSRNATLETAASMIFPNITIFYRTDTCRESSYTFLFSIHNYGKLACAHSGSFPWSGSSKCRSPHLGQGLIFPKSSSWFEGWIEKRYQITNSILSNLSV